MSEILRDKLMSLLLPNRRGRKIFNIQRNNVCKVHLLQDESLERCRAPGNITNLEGDDANTKHVVKKAAVREINTHRRIGLIGAKH